ncbi:MULTISPECIES: hypothetical protein [Legionella]|uniref:Uncharacterized protein n=1 Tax=Legionella resiliens TaxID=2905958 RepID=A0ABS8X936_9GAMM|nr:MULTISPECIES: hypothetical protein [unclassified Legionella]MCE0724336.1 hypothetical protein [Legionella sp. 9fVS26]MCE3533488.1 hypothetical protein [Legionella sp. 8cVS16]QLZ69673.1 hypothetical protein FOLKNPGA_02471 [Legionella sp. PC1000]
MVATNPFAELMELLQKLLDTIGMADEPSEESRILFEMLENALNNNLLNDFLEAASQSGKTLDDILRSVIIAHSRQLLEDLVRKWIELEKPISEFLQAVKDVHQEALDEVCNYMISFVARKMTAAEIATAQLIFGSSLEYDTIYFSEVGTANAIIFGVQDFFTNNPSSRPFVTFKLVNHDLDDGPMTDRTMIHELTHVWQYQEAGPIYMIQAIHAQTLGAGYNYGYTTGSGATGYINGDGAGPDLTQAITNNPGLTPAEVFELFNREQQAQIIMHYYQRKYVESPPLNVGPWQPFQNVVFTPL